MGLPDKAKAMHRYAIHRETIEHAEHLILVPRSGPTDAPASPQPWQTVPEGHVLVCGDHRSESLDSRAFGPVPVESIEGIARVIWLSIGPDGIRPDRMGRTL